MAAVPANLNFPRWSIAENVLHDLYYNYAKRHAYHILNNKICTNRLDYAYLGPQLHLFKIELFIKRPIMHKVVM